MIHIGINEIYRPFIIELNNHMSQLSDDGYFMVQLLSLIIHVDDTWWGRHPDTSDWLLIIWPDENLVLS